MQAHAGSLPCASDAVVVPDRGWSPQPVRIGQDFQACFVRTNLGAVARIDVALVDPYSTGSVALHWVTVPARQPVFAPPPQDLRARWDDGRVEVLWTGHAEQWLVDAAADGRTRRSSTTDTHLLLPELPEDGVHTVTVRGQRSDGTVTLPATLAVTARRRAAQRGVIELKGDWYRENGGIDLAAGAAERERPDVVMYLYGVYVPGGAVAKIGDGEARFEALVSVPDPGLSPVYDRVDEHEVLAVRLADGRYGALRLEAIDGKDLRDGLAVHYVFLPDGRRDLLPSPALSYELAAGTAVVRWDAVDGADHYLVRALPEEATESVEGSPWKVVLPIGMHRLGVRAVGTDGEMSGEARIEVPIYPDGYAVGRFTLDAHGRDAVDLDRGVVVAVANGAVPGDADLRIVGAAGGASSLSFEGPGRLARVDGLTFGEFPADEGAVAFSERLAADDRDAGADVFLVRTTAGGLASVHIESWGYPKVAFRYVLRPASAEGR